jgi:hypothetical protein
VVIRRRAEPGTVPIPAGLRIRTEGAQLTIRWRHGWQVPALVALAVALVVAAFLWPATSSLFLLGGVAAGARGGLALWRAPWLRVAGGRLSVRGVELPIADLVQIYVVRATVDELEVRALDHGGAPWTLVRTGSLWEALAIEHLVEEHLRLHDVRM